MAARSMKLSAVKAALSEVVRSVRRTGTPVVITVDGEPAAQIVPVAEAARTLTQTEIATHNALMDAVRRMQEDDEPFDAAELIAEGRR